MSVYSEREFAVKLFRNSSDIFFQQFNQGGISEVYESIKNISPRNDGKMPYSRSLDQCSALISSGNHTKSIDPSQQVDNNKKGEGRETGCKTVAFKPTNENFIFEKCKTGEESKLESFLTEVVLNKMEKLLPVKVFFPKGKSYDPPFANIRVQETDTVQNVIENVIKIYNETTKGSQLPKGLKGYQLNTAEEDGSPDEFCLRLDQYVARMGSSMFALVINSDANIRLASVDRSPLVVLLPDNTKTLFQFQVNLKVSDLIRKVCDKRGLNSADFHIETSTGVLASDLPLEDISGGELQLCPNVSEKDEEGEISGSILSDHDAYKYKVFDVIYGKKKNYLLGVDEEHIQIFKKKGGQKDAAGKQREVRKVVEIQSVSLSGDKLFTITWVDGKQDIFETKQRKEIVEKIEYIQKRKKEQDF